MNSPEFTIVIKAKNEASQIADAIKSAHLLSQHIIVVDDSSADETREISALMGARVITGEAHNGQIDKLDKQGFMTVTSGWIVRMDADERITSALAEEFRRVASDQDNAGARFARLHYMFGAPVRFGGWFDPHQLALFRADAWDRSWSAEMHTQVPVSGQIATIDPARAYSLHYDYDRISTFIRRSLINYASAEAESEYLRGRRFRKGDLLLRPFKKLFGRYIIRRGYKDGTRGLVLAALLASYEISVGAHLWELGRKESNV